MTSNAQRLGTALVAGILVIGTAQSVTSAISEAHSLPVSQSDQCFEDEPCWSCVDDGNRVCGPTNDEGKPAGCYDGGGVMVAVWPCDAWKANR